MGLLPVLQPHLVHFHDYRSPTADFMRSAACAAQRMYARAGVGAPDPPQNSSFRASAGTLGTVGPGRNDIGPRLDRLVAALAHRLACTLESERRRDERHCGRGRPRKARLVVQRAGAPHEGQDPRRVCLQRPPGPRAVLCRVRTCTCRVTQHACCTQNLHGARKFLARSSADSTRMHGRLSRSVRKTASRGLARRPLVRAPGGSSARALSDPHSPQGPPHGQHPLGGSLPRVTSPETVDRGPR